MIILKLMSRYCILIKSGHFSYNYLAKSDTGFYTNIQSPIKMECF